MTREDFEGVFKIGQVVLSGGRRATLKIDRIFDEWFSIIPVSGKLQLSQRMYFNQLAAVIDGFNEIDPKRIQPTIETVFTSRGLRKERTTENYLYGFARAYLEATKLPEEIIDPDLYPEGSKKTAIVNAYERNFAAKAKCLKVYGTRCSVCEVDLRDVYGDIGEGFVHVHHLNPIAARGGAYLLDPVKDLRPVCPNCHAMLHRENPPLTPQELQMRMKMAAAKS